ncbi:TPA: CBS domain-containing protein [Candidatus Woesearchaeota archaeon]|nr:transcriptional regulator [archaeon]HIJ11522.1 CBS domain-containing protein [Candidatus Woesearchaeota archaeon]
MFKSLSEIKRLRKKFHLNQKELADLAHVSQSLIAKIEAGKVEPTFSKAMQIFTALETCREKEEIKASSLMHRKVVFVDYNNSFKDIIAKMKKHGISQMPVLRRENVCGLITESKLLQEMMDHPTSISEKKAEEIMDDAPPIITPKAGIHTVLELLREYPIVLVAEKGDVKGIISKADLLGKIE